MVEVRTYLLSPWDDYWIHQASLPMDQVLSSDKQWCEHSWFGFWSKEQRIKAALNFVTFPNMRTSSISCTLAVGSSDREQDTYHLVGTREIPIDHSAM